MTKRAHLTVMAALLLATPAMAGEFVVFQSPSGNIHCDAYDGEDRQGRVVECEVLEMASSKPVLPRPKDCDLEWGGRFILPEQGKANLLCYGDTLRSADNPVLSYGKSQVEGSIACDSSEKGMTCTNADGHGFSLSRGRQRLF